jgi:hypothetical protein
MIVPIIPFVTGLIFAIEQSTKGLPVPIWVWAMIIVGAVAFVVVSFFAFHRVRLERDSKQTAELKRQELKEWRQRFSNVTLIPDYLLDMYERAKELCERNKKPLIKDYWAEIAESFFEARQAPTVVPPMDKMPSKQEIMDMINSTPDPLGVGSGSTIESMNRLILNIQATMSLHNTGAMALTNNDDLYKFNHGMVKSLQQNLPNEINTKIKDCILISNGLASLLCVDFSNRDNEISEELLISMQYMSACMDDWTQKMRSEIAGMIADFLLGNDERIKQDCTEQKC